MDEPGMSAPALLESIDQIDVAWLRAALAAGGVAAAASICGFRVAGIGEGKVSDTARVSLEYSVADAAAPQSVICKFQPRSAAAHQFALDIGLYRGEVNAYRVIDQRSACLIPKPYWIAGGETQINLVLEDLSTRTTPGNQIVGCGLDDARAALQEIARLHGHFYPLDDREAPGWMTRMRDAGRAWTPIIDYGNAQAMTLFADDLPSAHLQLLTQIPAAARIFFERPQPHLCLTHGDFRVDNLLFETRGGALRAVIIDWQNAGLRNPMFDAGYFLAGSMTIEKRRAHERALLQDYLCAFAEFTDRYDETTALADYRVHVISGLLQTIAAVGFLCAAGGASDPAVKTFLIALLERNLAVIADWETLKVLR